MSSTSPDLIDAPRVDAPRVDLHCHILPGIDDGPPTLADAIELSRALVADGATDVIATPHQLGPYDLENSGPEVRVAVAALQGALVAADIPLRLHVGGDVRIDERLPQLLAEEVVLTVADRRRHLLLELPHRAFVDPLPLIHALGDLGLQTIMTHPERHSYLTGSHRRLTAWLDAGAVLQITAGSLLGDFGRQAYDEAWRMLDDELVDVIASDAHDVRRRPPRMRAACDAVAAVYGLEYAQRLTYDNPRRVLAGEHLGV